MNYSLFDLPDDPPRQEKIGPASLVMRGFALRDSQELLREIAGVATLAPFRQMYTPGGYLMSVAMTSCGQLGWITDRQGYRYSHLDPVSGRPWPPMPASFITLAARAAEQAGFARFTPDACLINRYSPTAKMSLHQDKDERDLRQPIVSVSLGLEAVFLWGGLDRADRAQRILLRHGDVVVWGGADRLRYHGVLPLKDNQHPLTGACRYNLTFRHS